MASDGTIKISTKLDNSQAMSAMSKFGSIAKTGLKTVTASAAAMGGALAGISLYAIKTGIDFESAFAGVKKTVDATDAELQGFRDGIREMSKDIPQAATEIAGVAEAAGQLGIKNEYLLDFTRVMTDLGVSTNMSATEAATSLARLANITKMPQEKFSNLGSTIVALGNNLATTEAEITEMGLRLAGAGKQAGMSEAEILGMAGALSSVGIEAEAGGSAMSTVMSKIQLAVEQGGASLEQFADVSGMSAEEFRAAFEEDAAGAIVSFIMGLGEMESRGQSAIGTLAEMEITEIRQRDALLRLSGAGDVLSESLGIATKAWDENNALTDEAAQRYETLESRLQILKNNIDDFGITVYDSMREPLKNAVNEGIEYVGRLHDAFASGGLKGVVKELGSVFDDVTDNIAGTSDAAAGIITPLKNIVSIGSDLVKTVLPVAAKGLRLLAENTSTAIPATLGLVAAYKELKIIKTVTDSSTKLGATIKKGSEWWKTASQAVGRYADQMEAAKFTGRSYNVELTAGQAVLGLFKGKTDAVTASTKIMTTAQQKLGAVIASNPLGTAVVAATAFVAISEAVIAQVTKQTSAEREHSKTLKETARAAEESLKSANERKQAYEEFSQTQNKQAAGDIAQLDRLASLNAELNNIVDANGRVKAGEEDRAAFIVSQLSNALGMEISLTDNQIGNYQELQGQIQSTIQQKRIQAVLAAQEAKYQEAVNNQMEAAAEASAHLTAMKKAENAVSTEKAELSKLEAEHDQAAIDGNKWLVKILDEKIKKQKENVETAEEALTKEQEAYKSSTETLAQYASDIEAYTSLAEAAATRNAEAIEAAISQVTAGIKTASTATNEELQKQVIDVANMEAMIQQEVANGTPGFTQALVNQASEASAAALEEFAKVAPQTAEELAKVPPEAVAALIAGNMKGQLSSEAQGAVQGMLDQFDGMDSETQEAFANVIYGALAGLEGFDELADPAKEGVDAFLESLKGALQVHSPSRAVQEIFAQVWPGASQGLSEGEGELTQKGESVIQNFLSKLGGEGLFEKAREIGTNIMSFFGFGVSSQTENSGAAGKANADAVNTSAGSVDLTPTGIRAGTQYTAGVSSQAGNSMAAGKLNASEADRGAGTINPTRTGILFGSLLGGGIGSMASVLFGKGRGISDNARSGAGSVDPTGTGGRFGSQYAGGVEGTSRKAYSSGVSLVREANSGAGSESGYGPGSDFGAGFVDGIGAWLGRAASAAANLALTAYNALRSKLDEHSPSRKTKKSGKNFDLGMGLGIEENSDYPVSKIEELSDNALNALDTDAIREKMKGLDIPDIMSQVYATTDFVHQRAAEKVTAPAMAEARLQRLAGEEKGTLRLSEEDIGMLAKRFGIIAGASVAEAVEGMGIKAYDREFARVVREANKR